MIIGLLCVACELHGLKLELEQLIFREILLQEDNVSKFPSGLFDRQQLATLVSATLLWESA